MDGTYRGGVRWGWGNETSYLGIFVSLYPPCVFLLNSQYFALRMSGPFKVSGDVMDSLDPPPTGAQF